MRTLAILLALSLPAMAEEKVVTLKPGALTQTISSQALNAEVDNSYTLFLQGAQRGVLQIDIRADQRSFSGHALLENTDQAVLFDEFANAPGERLVLQHFIADGKYRLRVGDAGKGGFNAPYTMTLNYLPVPDSHEPNDDFSGAKDIPFGKEVGVTLFAAAEQTDADYFRIQLPAGESECFIGGQKDMSPMVTLFNLDMEEVWSDVAANPGANFRSKFANVPSGSYFLKVTDSGGRSSVKPLIMQIRKAP